MTSITVKDIKNDDFESLCTFVRKDTKRKLFAFAKKNKSFTGSWDVDSAIRELLWVYEVFWNVNTRLDTIENEFQEVKAFVMQQQTSEQKPEEKKEKDSDGLLGRHHIKEKEEKIY